MSLFSHNWDDDGRTYLEQVAEQIEQFDDSVKSMIPMTKEYKERVIECLGDMIRCIEAASLYDDNMEMNIETYAGRKLDGNDWFIHTNDGIYKITLDMIFYVNNDNVSRETRKG